MVNVSVEGNVSSICFCEMCFNGCSESKPLKDKWDSVEDIGSTYVESIYNQPLVVSTNTKHNTVFCTVRRDQWNCCFSLGFLGTDAKVKRVFVFSLLEKMFCYI